MGKALKLNDMLLSSFYDLRRPTKRMAISILGKEGCEAKLGCWAPIGKEEGLVTGICLD
jgi:hypothetical protein